MTEYEFEKWLRSSDGGDCLEVKFFDGRLYAAVKPRIRHMQMIIGSIDAKSITDIYDYHTVLEATIALRAWNGKGEPDLWFRHPPTGRRRPYGQRDQEYIIW